MSTVTGKLLVWLGEQFACVRIVGRANFALAVEFRKLLRHLASRGHQQLVLDLSECAIMDSTFLGVLAYAAGAPAGAGVSRPAGGRMGLLNTKHSVREVIDDLGIARLFDFVERDLAGVAFESAPPQTPASPEEAARTSLEAHELLMALHPANVEKFKEVARFLAEDLKQCAGSHGAGGG